jgi:molecular chaperone Hsp33
MSDDLDRALGLIIPERHARGRLVRLGPVLEEILSAHGYPPVIEALMAEALVITALLGALLKNNGLKNGEGQLTMQAQLCEA